jgi:hypothetical protein
VRFAKKAEHIIRGVPRSLALLTLSLLAITPLTAQIVGEYPVSLPQSTPALPQQRPSVGFSGRNYLVVWEEGNSVYSNLLDIQGRPLSGFATLISGSAESAGNPHVAFVLDSYLVVWLSYAAGQESQVHVSRVAPDTGEIVDTSRISTYGASPFALDLKSDGTSALLVLAGGGLTGMRLDRNGQVVDTLSLVPRGYPAGSPTVAWNGSEWLVAFEEFIFAIQPLSYSYAKIWAVRLSPSLTLLDPQPLPIAPGVKDFAPVVAASLDQFFIAWTRLDDSNGTATTHGRYVPNVGEPGLDITLGAGSAESVIWDGKQFALGVAVETSRSNFDLWAMHVGVNGDVRDRLFIGRTTGDSPAFALFTANDRLLAAYPRLSFEAPYDGVTRIFVRQPAAPIRSRAIQH